MLDMLLSCISCKFETDNLLNKRCPECGSFMIVKNLKLPRKFTKKGKELGIWVFEDFLPRLRTKITLGEGNTPIIKATRLSSLLSSDIYFKNEGVNPTGSFLDRGSAVYVSFMKENRIKELKCFATGNLGSSLAAYASRADMVCEVFVHERINHAKLLQIIMLGAKISMHKDLERYKKEIVTQADPFFIEGLKTQFLEVYEYFSNDLPDYVVVPIGSGVNIFSIYKGYEELIDSGIIDKRIKFIGIKPDQKTASSIVDLDPSFLYCEDLLKEMEKYGFLIVEETGKEEIIKAMVDFARLEGILVEPASSITLAGLRKFMMKNKIRNKKILIILTGTGLKEISNLSLIKFSNYRNKELGYTKLKILKILKDRDMSGYELWKRLKEEGTEIRLPTLYQHLKELEEMNLLSSIPVSSKRRTILRKLTPLGENYLELQSKNIENN